MTRDAFIRKWLDCGRPYNDENRMAMLDDLDKVILRGMATDNTRLAELEAQGWRWWVQYEGFYGRDDWTARIVFGEKTIHIHRYPTKAEAEAACVEYLLNLNV